jgi:hypothetical protein
VRGGAWIPLQTLHAPRGALWVHPMSELWGWGRTATERVPALERGVIHQSLCQVRIARPQRVHAQRHGERARHAYKWPPQPTREAMPREAAHSRRYPKAMPERGRCVPCRAVPQAELRWWRGRKNTCSVLCRGEATTMAALSTVQPPPPLHPPKSADFRSRPSGIRWPPARPLSNHDAGAT